MSRIVQAKAVEVHTKYPERITSIIPKSKVLHVEGEVSTVLIHWGIDECRVLTNLGFKNIPSPMVRDYDWPGLYTPFRHQIKTASFLTLNHRAYVLNDMGTGKTSASAWAMDYLMKQGTVKRALIICPLSIINTAWRNDLFKTLMHRTVAIAYGTVDKRLKVIEQGADITIINFDGVQGRVLNALLKAKYDLFIIDEATAVKTVNTQRWKAINQLIPQDKRLWLMTGTPAAQSPVDAYGLVRLMHPHKVPRSQGGFKALVRYQVSQYQWLDRDNANEYVHSIMQPAIRYTKDECLDLPELLYASRDIPLTAQQDDYYKQLKKDMLIAIGKETVSSVNAAVEINKLLQISSGAVYTESGNVVEFDVSTRYKELNQIIKDSSHNTLVFCTFRHSIARLQAWLTKDGHIVDVIHGGVSLKDRSEIIDRFQSSGKRQVLLLQPQAASHGITLHAANTIVWWSPTTSYETYAQANARVHRAGQVNACTVIHLVSSGVEKRLYSALQGRQNQQINLLELYKAVITES